MKENNKLLAEYLGVDYHHAHCEDCSWNPDKRWDKLMMVVEKIEEEGYLVEIDNASFKLSLNKSNNCRNCQNVVYHYVYVDSYYNDLTLSTH